MRAHVPDGRKGHRLALDVDEIQRLYTETRLTVAEIARRLGCGETTILRRLAERRVVRRPRGPRPPGAESRSVTWNADLAWTIGVIATDGNLARDGRHITVVSTDIELLEAVRRCVNTATRMTADPRRAGRQCYRLAWSDARLHAWLFSIGLRPAKSRTLGAIAVPDPWFRDLFRGCIDGDGTICVYVDRHHQRQDERYVYERLALSLVSASRPFLAWVRAAITRLHGARGSLTVSHRPERAPTFTLKYDKRAGLALIAWIYYAREITCLARKRATALAFRERAARRSRLNASIVRTRAQGRPGGAARPPKPVQ